jgi:hypothetical protein
MARRDDRKGLDLSTAVVRVVFGLMGFVCWVWHAYEPIGVFVAFIGCKLLYDLPRWDSRGQRDTRMAA